MADKPLPRGDTGPRRAAQADSGEPAQPRLPHERDESSDSQAQGVRDVMRQAKADVERGLQDTSRKPEMDRAYEQQKGEGAPGTEPAAEDRSGVGATPGKRGGR